MITFHCVKYMKAGTFHSNPNRCFTENQEPDELSGLSVVVAYQLPHFGFTTRINDCIIQPVLMMKSDIYIG